MHTSNVIVKPKKFMSFLNLSGVLMLAGIKDISILKI